MSDSPQVWLADDGALALVRDLLIQAEVDYGEGAPPPGTRVQLLVTSARGALVGRSQLPSADTHLVLYEDASRSLRKVLERSGCDLVMPLPLNTHAFHLLLNFALYAGPEKRRSRRVVMSEPVRSDHDKRHPEATLVSLSLRGCGFISDAEARVGSEIQLRMPKALTGARDLKLTGRVLSSKPADGGGFEIAMAFRLMEVEVRRILNGMMDRSAAGAELRPRTGAAARRPKPPPANESERRDGPRKRFTRRVLAAGAGISHVLIGRDLSAGGMRVRPDPDLELGDVLKLAVHGHPGQPAIMLKAIVVRDDGDDGVVLRFEDVPKSIGRRLEEMVGDLPALPPGKRGDGEGPGNVVTEVVGRG